MNSDTGESENLRNLMAKYGELHVKRQELKTEMARMEVEALRNGASLEAVGQMKCW